MRGAMALDEVSQMLGELKAQNGHIAHTLNKMDDKLTLMNGSISKAHHRLDVLEPEVITKKQAMLGIIVGGGAAGLGGTGIFKFITSLFGMT